MKQVPHGVKEERDILHIPKGWMDCSHLGEKHVSEGKLEGRSDRKMWKNT
jgi:hypothetical protein